MRKPLRDVPIHNLRPNHTSWTPPALISFDTETRWDYDHDDEVHTLRLWCARITDRRHQGRKALYDESEDGLFGEDLAIIIHKWCTARRTVWAYAHNLGFDLTVSDLVQQMLYLGWEVTEFAVNSGSPFVRMRRGDHSLTLSDSWSWFQCALDTVAEAVGMVKPPLPREGEPDAKMMERCRADVNILHTAILQLMEWWEDNALGKWNITGAASGWNAMRHIPSPEQILIRPDETECDSDRRAIYGGKRFAWRHGNAAHGHYTEIDIEKAYTTVVRDLPLPIGRQARFTSLPIDHKWLDCRRWGVIAEVTISTDTPKYPVRSGNTVWYPVGRFRTTLAGPEILEARDTGALEAVRAGWLHRLGYALRPWAQWCLASLADDTGTVPEVARLVHRAWARSAVGKWNQRGWQVIELGPSPNQGWGYEEAWQHDKGVPAGIVDFGGTRYHVAAVNQSDNAYPGILAYVESYVRVALGRAIATVGDKHMVACDTDGYICDAMGANQLGIVNEAIAPLHARPKRHFRRVKVTGPQHLELDRTVRRSGIPASAEPQLDGSLWARTWPKYAWQLANGRQGAYVRPSQTYRLAATYAPGWCLQGGTVVPVEMELADDGTNRIVPFPRTRYAARGDVLAEHQNRNLERYIHG